MEKNVAAKNLAPTIGLEVHIELRTESGMFCGCSTDHFGKAPNTNTCPVCLGLPGALPVPNKKALEWAMMLALALNSTVNKNSKFDRKHYNYPDLPKGYQISQYDMPLALGGFIETTEGVVRIRRVHIEEDTGKLQHITLDGRKVSLVDFNRSGVPLVEIVTEPDIHTGSQAKEFAQELQKIARALGISDCDMEKGSMRLEANISWGLDLDYKVEVKNLNSFKFVDRAINFELNRQKKLLDKGETPRQETRGWSESKNETFSQRFKETEADYRYFPEPDIPPMEFSDDYIADIKAKIPELPQAREKRFIGDFKIKSEYSKILNSNLELSSFSEELFALGKKEDISADNLAGILINQKIVPSSENLKKVIYMAKSKVGAKITDEKLIQGILVKAIGEFPKAIADYKNGKDAALSVILGRVMQETRGQADPKLTLRLLKSII